MLRLKDIGHFYVSGLPFDLKGQATERIAFTKDVAAFEYNPNGRYMIGQAYVQYFLQEKPKHALPILFQHGGGFSGSMWETTPDGRAGWLKYFLAEGYDCYVIDNVERGRAGWNAVGDGWEGKAIVRTQEEAWALFRFGLTEDYQDRKMFQNQKFPVNALSDFSKQFIPRWSSTRELQIRALSCCIEKIGPCITICHSQGGDIALTVASQMPDLCPITIALEPSGFPKLPKATLQKQNYLFLMGDYLSYFDIWRSLEEMTKKFAVDLQNHGAMAEFWHLPDLGVEGNSHMMMLDKNSDEIARLLGAWLHKFEMNNQT